MQPRLAATVILMRDPLELLMVRRSPQLAFMAGYWVFPGGKVEADDASPEAAARRELTEEVAIELPTDTELVPFSRWITPVGLPRRFDTWFFLARATAEIASVPPRVDGSEIVDASWVTPTALLASAEPIAFPTRHQLEELAGFSDAASALEACRGRTIEPILPEIVHDDGSPAVVIPGTGAAPSPAPEIPANLADAPQSS